MKKNKTAHRSILHLMVALVVGVSAFLCFLLPMCTTSIKGLDGITHTYSGFDLINFESQNNNTIVYSIFAVAVMIVGGIILINFVLSLLQQLGVIKSKNINLTKIENAFVFVLAIFSLLCLLFNILIVADLGVGEILHSSIGFAMIVLSIISMLSVVSNLIIKRKVK